MIGLILIVMGFIAMSQKIVTYDDHNNPVEWRTSPLFFISGIIIYVWGALSICYLIWETGTNPTMDERHLSLIRKILRKQHYTPGLKHIGNKLTWIGFITTAIGILVSPAFIMFLSSNIFPQPPPQVSYVPTLIIIILGIIMALSGFWIKYLALVEEERSLGKAHGHSQIISGHLSAGSLSARDSISNSLDLAKNRRSQRQTKPLMVIIILVAVIVFNPSISPIQGIHDSDLDGYSDVSDPFPNNPQFWGGNLLTQISLDVGGNTTDWLISVTQISASHQVDANEIFIQVQIVSNVTYQTEYLPLIALSDNSPLSSIGVHYLDTAPLGILNVGDQIALDKGTYNGNTSCLLTDSTGTLYYGQVNFFGSY
jgi:hypothetical protein